MHSIPMPFDEFTKNLYHGVLRAIADGSTHIIIWGITPSGLSLLSTLHCSGMLGFVSGLIDERPSLHGQTLFGMQVQSPQNLSQIELDTLVVTVDQEKEEVLGNFARLDTRIPRVIMSGNAHYEFLDPVFHDIVASCPVKSKAGGYQHMLIHLYQALQSIATRGLQGSIAEFGVYQGGTTVFLAKVLQHYGHTGTIYGFDTFTGFPQRGIVLDMYRDRKCEFPDYDTVSAYCAPYNIKLVKGDIRQTYTTLRGVDLVLSFFDTDNYTATRTALELCYDQTIPGGFLAFDHYYSPQWEQTIGERMAVREVLAGKPVFHLHGTGIFMKL